MTFRHDDSGTDPDFWTALPEHRDVAGLAVPRGTNLLVIAAHPDDETLGAGGLISRVTGEGGTVRVVVITDGERSHPDSTTWTPAALATERRREVMAALRRLGCAVRPVFLGVPDGTVADHADEVARRLASITGASSIAAPWRGDNHPDHEAAGRIAADLARITDNRLLEYPIWFWHWGGQDPGALPWSSVRRVRLSQSQQAAKKAALALHRTQVAPLSDRPGDETLLSPHLLRHFTTGSEHFVVAQY